MAKEKKPNWWTQKVGSKSATSSGKNTKPVVAKNAKPTVQKPGKPERIGRHEPIGTNTRAPRAGTCSCGAYTYSNGRCRDSTCSNH